MEQQVVDHFNQATAFHIGCPDRIKNLIANSHLAVVDTETAGVMILTFNTTRKGKVVQSITYVINNSSLPKS